MNNARVTVPTPRNEPVLSFAPGSPEKVALKAQLDTFAAGSIEIPLIIGGRNVTTGDLGTCILPHDHRRSLARYHKGNAKTVNQAIAAAAERSDRLLCVSHNFLFSRSMQRLQRMLASGEAGAVIIRSEMPLLSIFDTSNTLNPPSPLAV